MNVIIAQSAGEADYRRLDRVEDADLPDRSEIPAMHPVGG
jgi:hypothetical protein